MHRRDSLEISTIRVAMMLHLPGRWFQKPPDPDRVAARSGKLSIEIVSHCWQYAHLHAYQLSSLVNFPPTRAQVRMTVFHAAEDAKTQALLQFFGDIQVPGVTWNWQPLSRTELFRRAIGRNRVARASDADWIWFTDCDIIFHRDCIDTLADRLQGRRDYMTYPKQEHVTAILDEGDPLMIAERDRPRVVDIDTSQFTPLTNPPKAKGAYQIVHGDVARQIGYCAGLRVFQQPAARWSKTYEDAAFRWMLGTEGVGLDVPGIYRIRHMQKGRYGDNRTAAYVRGNIRRAKAHVKER